MRLRHEAHADAHTASAHPDGLIVCCVFVQPDALAHSGAHPGAHSSSHTGPDGDAQHGHTKVVQLADVLCVFTGIFALWNEGAMLRRVRFMEAYPLA